MTELLGGRAIMDVLATLVDSGKLGRTPLARDGEPRADDVSTTEEQPGG